MQSSSRGTLNNVMKFKLTDGFRMSGDHAVKSVEVAQESAWLCAQRRVMGRDIESPTKPAVDCDRRSKRPATPTNAPSGKSLNGRG